MSTQRKAGMSSFEPSRIPAWLAPVCEERSGSHSARACVPSATQRAMVGAFPSRIARRSTGSASPSISRKRIPGTSVSSAAPWRRAIRCTTLTVYVSSSFVPRITWRTTLAAAIDEGGQERPAEVVDGEAVVEPARGKLQRERVEHEHEDEAEPRP